MTDEEIVNRQAVTLSPQAPAITIPVLVDQAHVNAREKGFWDSPLFNVGEKLALIHSEVSEALEEARENPEDLGIRYTHTGKPTGFTFELADIIIRVADLAGYLNVDLNAALHIKMAYNRTRPPKHGKAF